MFNTPEEETGAKGVADKILEILKEVNQLDMSDPWEETVLMPSLGGKWSHLSCRGLIRGKVCGTIASCTLMS